MFIKVTPTSGPFMVNVDAIETINSVGDRSVICFRRDAEHAYLNVEETVDQILDMINRPEVDIKPEDIVVKDILMVDILHYLENQPANTLKERVRNYVNTKRY